jgi:hypothetical protein
VVIPDAIDATLLREIQAAWIRVAAPIQKQWAEDIKHGEGIDGLFFENAPASSIAAPTTRGAVLYRTFCENWERHTQPMPHSESQFRECLDLSIRLVLAQSISQTS